MVESVTLRSMRWVERLIQRVKPRPLGTLELQPVVEAVMLLWLRPLGPAL